MLYFDSKVDVPYEVLVWFHLPHFPLHYQNDEPLETIKNKLVKYINKSWSKSMMFSHIRICVEVDLEKGLLEVIKLSIDNWSHL